MLLGWVACSYQQLYLHLLAVSGLAPAVHVVNTIYMSLGSLLPSTFAHVLPPSAPTPLQPFLLQDAGGGQARG
jgi:hypothetical protein